MSTTKEQILENWNQWEMERKIPVKSKGSLRKGHIAVIKNTNTRSVCRIDVPEANGVFPVILKVYKGSASNSKQNESTLYEILKDTEVSEFIPTIYDIQTVLEEEETWIFMERLNVMTEQSDFTHDDLYRIVSRVAQLHATTFEKQPLAKLISETIPGFQSNRRAQNLENMKTYLQEAKNHSFLKPLIDKHCPRLYELVELDDDFPDVLRSDRCLNHGDLHLGNICYDKVKTRKGNIQFIDFSPTFSPCWLDIVKPVEFITDHHPKWSNQANKIRNRSIQIYTKEMNKKGITFSEDPGRLYRTAYLTTVFEKELRRHLKFILQGHKRFIFPLILKKIAKFSEEVNLI